jgi:pimeloyl-ACP methyl ester carboxylesterase
VIKSTALPALGLALAGALVACTPATPPESTEADTRHYGQVQFKPCTLAGSGGLGNVAAQCATLEVPEDRSAPGGRRIELALAWLPATEEAAATDDPVVFFAGGPGQSARKTWPQLDGAFAAVRRQRHVLLVDQRGTGDSNLLQCQPGEEQSLEGSSEVVIAAIAEAAGNCARSAAAHADPRFYTTTDAVADLEQVRQALGVEQWNLVGVSYGTRMAQKYAAAHPQHVRSLVLDGVAPNDLVIGGEFARTFEDALALQAAQCAQLPECKARFPQDPRAQLGALVQRLRQAPAQVDYRDPATAQMRQTTVSADTVTSLAFMFSYLPQTAALLPLVLDEASQGRYESLASLHQLMGRSVGDSMARGMQWSVVCAEDADRLAADGADADTLLGPDLGRVFFAACSQWPSGSRPQGFTDALKSQAPALLVSGELDPVTPPRYGEQVLSGLENGRHLVLKGQGHGNLGSGCMPRLLGQFLEEADASALDASCLDSMSYIPPFTSFNGWQP